MRTRIHREKKEYLPEIQAGKRFVSPNKDFSLLVTPEIKYFYEQVAKYTGLSFWEIILETSRIFENVSDEEINAKLGLADYTKTVSARNFDITGIQAKDSDVVAKRLSDLIIESRCID